MHLEGVHNLMVLSIQGSLEVLGGLGVHAHHTGCMVGLEDPCLQGHPYLLALLYSLGVQAVPVHL